MKNTQTINKLPQEIQVILSCICRKWQSDFLDKNVDHKRTKEDYKKQVIRDRQLIEILTTEIERMNNGKLFTQYGLENTKTYTEKYQIAL